MLALSPPPPKRAFAAFWAAELFQGALLQAGDLDLADAQDAGALLLGQALVEPEEDRYGTQFSTYAVPKIAGEIRRYLRDNGLIKVGRSLREQSIRRRRMVTRVPFPSWERTVRRSMKLSMMVKPMPLRSGPPVV